MSPIVDVSRGPHPCHVIQINELRHIYYLQQEQGHVLGQGHVPNKVAVWYNMF